MRALAESLEEWAGTGERVVVATVVEYRPIYVNGDVSKPGEHPFRPQMTVRQAVALSGGYDSRLILGISR